MIKEYYYSVLDGTFCRIMVNLPILLLIFPLLVFEFVWEVAEDQLFEVGKLLFPLFTIAQFVWAALSIHVTLTDASEACALENSISDPELDNLISINRGFLR
jgi:hypothetical protein